MSNTLKCTSVALFSSRSSIGASKMPEVIDYEFPNRQSDLWQKRDWRLWLDGKARKFVKGVDFLCECDVFRCNAFRQASRHGLKIATSIIQGDPPAIVIQCIHPENPTEQYDSVCMKNAQKASKGKADRKTRLKWPSSMSREDAAKIDRAVIGDGGLQELAVKTGVSMAEHVRRAIAEYVKRHATDSPEIPNIAPPPRP